MNYLRRLFMFHPGRQQVAARTRRSPGQHECERCGQLTHYKLMRFDHIESVTLETGFESYAVLAGRMLDAVPDGIQHLCKTCHDKKTAEERAARVRAKWRQDEAG